jgi:nucleoside-specific outer membrane channel protein Tsx
MGHSLKNQLHNQIELKFYFLKKIRKIIFIHLYIYIDTIYYNNNSSYNNMDKKVLFFDLISEFLLTHFRSFLYF